LLTAALRIRILGIPLERDEGEYAYAGQLILQGIPPYVLAYNVKFPGIYALYALVMGIFGQSISGIHLGLLAVNVLTIVLMFLLGRRVLDRATGLTAAASFAVLSLGQNVYGFTANAEHFVLVPALAGLVVLLKGLDERRCGLLFLAGLLLGAVPMVKQQGAAFTMLGGLYFAYTELRIGLRWRDLLVHTAIFVAGVCLPFVVTCLTMWALGVFDAFWLWTVQYARAYVSQTPLSLAPRIFWQAATSVMRAAWPIYLLALAGLVVAIYWQHLRKRLMFLLSFGMFSFLSVCPGFYFRQHYFLLLLPAMALFAGVCVSWIASKPVAVGASRAANLCLAAVVACLPLAVTVYSERNYLFKLDPMQISRQTYGFNPFPESLAVAEYIRAHTAEDATIVVLGSEPQIYFYAQRHSGTGFIYTYALMEDQPFAPEMQEQMIREIEASQPAYIVMVATPTSWLKRPSSPSLIFEWTKRYLPERYANDGLVDIQGPTETLYYWGEGAARHVPRSPSYLLVLKRKA
jgi:hypothetical protein